MSVIKFLKLPVRLTHDEIEDAGVQLAQLGIKRAGIEAEKKRITGKLVGELKKIDADIHDLCEKIDSGEEERDVEVEEREGWDGKKVVFRLDNGERVPDGQGGQVEIRNGRSAFERDFDDARGRMRAPVAAAPPPADATVAALARPPADHTPEQEADTPEDAEAQRDQRLAEEKAIPPVAGANAAPVPPAHVEMTPERAEAISKMLEPLRTKIIVAGGPAPATFIASIDFEARVGEEAKFAAFYSEAEGDDEQQARDALIEKLIELVQTKPNGYEMRAPKPKRVLDSSKVKKEKKLTIEIPVAAPTEPTVPSVPSDRMIPCVPDCAIEHEHTAERTAF